MNDQQKKGAALELAKLVQLIQHDACDGVLIVATHAANDTSTVIAIPPTGKRGMEKLMATLDSLHFRMRVFCYLGPKGGPISGLGGGEPDMDNPQ